MWLRVLPADALDGSLCIRQLRPGDESRVHRFFAQLSARTRYQRFLSPATEVPESLMRHLTGTDDTTRLTLIAEMNQEQAPELVGIGNLAVVDDRRAEAGLVVTDAWQGQGIGTELARRLLEAGERLGVKRFVVHTQWNNPALRALLARTADVVSTEMHSGVVEITVAPRPR